MVIHGEAHINMGGREVIFPVNESISRATLLTEDLVSAFEGWLEAVDPEGYTAAMERKRGYYTDGDEVYLDEWLNEALFDILMEYAPEGYYFGSLEGDGSDFGFWREDGTED